VLTVTLSLGVVTSIVLLGLTGLSAGGLIAPGYMALVLDQPSTLLVLAFITAATWCVVTLLSRALFLYGPRRFGIAILTSLVLSAALELWRPTLGPLGLDWRSVGYIVPGLIANQFDRQGFVPTTLMLAIAAPVVRVLAMLVTLW
jgi:poly-gamma-glutamate biosynthesis protein PgsC/CapC